jgi:hypothetical protein
VALTVRASYHWKEFHFLLNLKNYRHKMRLVSFVVIIKNATRKMEGADSSEMPVNIC